MASASAAGPGLQMELLHDLEQAGQRLEAIAARTDSGESREAAARVDGILEQVRCQGDAAVLELSLIHI